MPGIAILGDITPRAAAFILLAFCMRRELPEIYRRLMRYGSAVERLVMAGQHEDSYREGRVIHFPRDARNFWNCRLAGRGPMLRTAETSPQFRLYGYSHT